MDSPLPDDAPPAPSPSADVPPGRARFDSCRWQRPADAEQPACCGHRDVLPMAGTTSFNPESWCPDCAYYKAKRAPKARPPSPSY